MDFSFAVSLSEAANGAFLLAGFAVSCFRVLPCSVFLFGFVLTNRFLHAQALPVQRRLSAFLYEWQILCWAY